MRRRLFNILAALLLLLAVVAAAATVTSFFVGVRFTSNCWEIHDQHATKHRTEARVGCGGVAMVREIAHAPWDPSDASPVFRRPILEPAGSEWQVHRAPRYPFPFDGQIPADSMWNRLGFANGYAVNTGAGGEIRWLTVPLWPLIVACAPLPLILMFRRWRTRRCARAGLCLRCGYDLRASKDRCPECGEPTPAGNVKETTR